MFCKRVLPWLGLILILTLTSKCNKIEGDYRTFSKFPIILDAVGTKVNLPVETFGASFLSLVDSNLILIERQVTENLFKVLKVPSLQFRYASGRVGRGPGEFGPIQRFLGEDSVSFYVRDPYGMKQVQLNDTAAYLSQSYDLNFTDWVLQAFIALNDSIIITEPSISEANKFKNTKHYLVVNNKTKELIGSFGDYPDDNLEDLKEKFLLYRTTFVYSDVHDRLLGFYFYFNKVDVFSGSGEFIRSVSLDDFKAPLEQQQSERVMYHSAPYATSENVYTIGYYSRIDKALNAPESFRTKLNIWNWEGEPIAQINLSTSIFTIAVSEKFGKIYGLNLNNELFEFDLPPDLKSK